jgi:type IV pilus assembly protein PilM
MRATKRPPVAVEIAPGGVLAAATTGESEITYAFRPLPEGAVIPSVSQLNLRSPEAITTAVGSALAEVSGTMRSVTVLLPDSATRVFSLEFDALPNESEDVIAVLRLRLKRVVPFDLETAKVSYQLLNSRGTVCKLLAVVVPRGVLNEYEAVVREAGYEAGAVLPSALSALAAITSDEPMLSAYLSGISLTTSITTRNNILLYRTHDLPDDLQERSIEIQRDIEVAVAYFEDELKATPSCLHYAGNVDAGEFSRSVLIRDIPIKDYASTMQNGTSLPDAVNPAGLVGALAGARFA